MERIKQAIEKVKTQHPGQVVPPPISRIYTPAVPHTQEPAQPLEGIRYSQTRVVKLRSEHLERTRIFSFNKNDPTSIKFDVLRTQILQTMEEKGWRTLAITSPTPEVGKTVVGINLAMSIAQQSNKTAMLVDFDLRHPRIGSYLGLSMKKSLNDYLTGGAELPEILVNPDMPRLVILPTVSAVPNPAEILSSRKVADLIKDLRQRYESRIVIFDLPSLLYSDDAIAVIPQIDCILLVVANGMCTKREVEDSLRHLSKSNLLGTVFNKA